jgi:thiol-disulfide isomerase/thioredoxin
MNIRERLTKHFRGKSPFRLTTDIVFYLLILALLLPVSRKYVSTGLNKLVMHRPAIINEARQVQLTDNDYNWELADMNGETVSFNEFRGEIIFFSIWATWCPPCRAEMPNIQRLYDSYGQKINFVLASQEDPATVERFMVDQGYDMPYYRLVRNMPESFQTSSIPTTFLLTGDGKIAVRKTGAARWDGSFFTGYLDKLLDE